MSDNIMQNIDFTMSDVQQIPQPEESIFFDCYSISYYNSILIILITVVFCRIFYNYLKKRTIYIEKFEQNKKIVYSIDDDINVSK